MASTPNDAIARDWDASQEKPKVASVTGVVNRKLKRMHPLTARELPFLKLHSPGDIKILLPSPTQFPAIAFKRGVTDKVYRDHSALLWDIVEIMKQDMAQLADEGVKYIQVDAPRYSYYLDPKWRRMDQDRKWARIRKRRSTKPLPRTTPASTPRETPGRDRRDSFVPRKQSQPLVRGRRLRCHRGEALRFAPSRPIPSGI